MRCLSLSSLAVLLIGIAVWAYLKAITLKVPEDIDGLVHPDFNSVYERFQTLLRDGWIQGSQYAVYYKNELVVDLAAGYADEVALRPLKRDNFIVPFSSIKSLYIIALAFVVETAGISFEDRVSKYWPEYAHNGKENVTIANLMLHQSGVCGLDRQFKLSDAEQNNEHYQTVLAEQRPLTPIGKRPYYHGMTYGLYIDQLIRHIDPKRRSLRDIFNEELATRCGELDIRVGPSLTEFHRLARYHPAGLRMLADNDGVFGMLFLLSSLLNIRKLPTTQNDNGTETGLTWQQFGGFIEDFQQVEQIGDPEVLRKLGFAAAGITATARDFARVYHILANGGFCVSGNGANSQKVRVLSSETVEKLIQLRYSGPSGLFPFEEKRGLFGWIFTSPLNTTMTGSPGAGGQLALADPHSGLSFTYFTNYQKPVTVADFAMSQLLQATYQVLDKRTNV